MGAKDDKHCYSFRFSQVLFTHNKLVTLVEIHVTPDVDLDLVTSAIQRKLTTWAGVACPEHSRFAIAPWTLVAMETGRAKRSAEMSERRNEAKMALYNWETRWLHTMM
jgi:hypothetical protein